MTIRSWIRNVFARPATRPVRKAKPRTRLGMEALEDRTVPATFTVTNTNDSGPGSLRDAITQAQSGANLGVADAIVFNDGTSPGTNFFDATPDIILLTSGQLELTDAATTTITGPGANLLSVSGNNASRVFQVNAGKTAELSGLTITGGRVLFSSGGGLSNSGTVSLTDCTVSGNGQGSFGGGGLLSSGTLWMTGCTVTGNNSTLQGGGLRLASGTATLNNTTISGNETGRSGIGGGIFVSATLTMTNCTVSGNRAEFGGGVMVNSGSVILGNTIVAGNTAFDRWPDVRNAVTSLGNNLIGKNDDSSGWVASDLTGTNAAPLDAMLAPLGNYGGPTQTMPPLPGSLALNAGNNALVPGGVTTDQRGFVRIDGGTVDIGAVEVQDVAQAVQAYIEVYVNGLVASGDLTSGQGEALILELRDNNGDAGKVRAFLNKVTAFLSEGILTQEQADELQYWGDILLLIV